MYRESIWRIIFHLLTWMDSYTCSVFSSKLKTGPPALLTSNLINNLDNSCKPVWNYSYPLFACMTTFWWPMKPFPVFKCWGRVIWPIERLPFCLLQHPFPRHSFLNKLLPLIAICVAPLNISNNWMVFNQILYAFELWSVAKYQWVWYFLKNTSQTEKQKHWCFGWPPQKIGSN